MGGFHDLSTVQSDPVCTFATIVRIVGPIPIMMRCNVLMTKNAP